MIDVYFGSSADQWDRTMDLDGLKSDIYIVVICCGVLLY
jgi:hypothetical protein